MSNRTAKAQYRKQLNGLRDLWNAFDPIGVMDDPDWPRDACDRYLPKTLQLLNSRSGTLTLARTIEDTARDEMHMPVSHEAAIDFSRKLEAWFEKPGSTRDE